MAGLCTCQKCGKTISDDNFYTYKDGRKTEMCKSCMTMHIDNFDPNTYLWLLEKMDVPYIEEEWVVLRDKAYAKNPHLNGMSVFGKYLSKMKLKQFKDFGWADTDRIRFERDQRAAEAKATVVQADAVFADEIQKKYEAGEITEAEYKTMMPTPEQNDRKGPTTAAEAAGGWNNFYDESKFISPDELPDPAAELTDEDRIYLAMKWGRMYQPSEWVELERNYAEMMNSFDIQDADTINTLILICKTNLKMNQAIDCGDMDGYQKLTRVYDSLRKSAKFTAAQKKEQNADYVDSIGELVAMGEREEGFIPRFVTDVPQDKVDATLNDMNKYVYNLITKDLGFGAQIENYIKKIELEREAAESTGELTDTDIADFYEDIERQKQEDLEVVMDDNLEIGGGEEEE